MPGSTLRSSIGGHRSTPSKGRIIFDTVGEENNPVNVRESRRSSIKRSKPDPPESSDFMKGMPLVDSRPDKRVRQMEAIADDDLEVSSTVSARREWLKDFGNKQKSTFPQKKNTEALKNTRLGTGSLPPRNTPSKPRRESIASVDASAASVLVSKMMTADAPKRNFTTPDKFKNRKDPVQATNEGYASVAELSQWLANDPTSTKKKKHVRRGRNVITKSRKFEKDLENVIIIENKISRGAVKDRKKWLQGAFGEDEESELGSVNERQTVTRYAKSEAGVGDLASSISVSDKKDWLKNAFRNAIDESRQEEDVDCGRSEIITNDAASSLSVSDKKDWLKNAFKKESGSASSKSRTPGRAMTDVMHSRHGGDDAAARAKKRFLQRSRRTPTKGAQTTGTPHSMSAKKMSGAARGLMSPPVNPTNLEFASPNKIAPIRRKTHEPRSDARTAGSAVEPSTSMSSSKAQVSDRPNEAVELDEDSTPVDFGAARQALIQRGKQNGHKMQVVNKVFMKKTKFEKIEKEHRRRSAPFGLLKPSWEGADPQSGRPSDAYEKTYVEDIAPKKSFEELP